MSLAKESAKMVGAHGGGSSEVFEAEATGKIPMHELNAFFDVLAGGTGSFFCGTKTEMDEPQDGTKCSRRRNEICVSVDISHELKKVLDS